jgi:hypothetical protein
MTRGRARAREGTLAIVLGDQLDLQSPALAALDLARDTVLLVEAPAEAAHVWSHKARIALFFAASGVESLRIGLNRAYTVVETRPYWLLRFESIGYVILAAIGIVGLTVFPTDPGWQVTTVAGRLHPTFAILAAGSLLFAGSRLAHPKRLIIDTVLLYGAGFAGYVLGGGAGAAERAALAVVGVLLFLAARRSR